MPIQFETVRDLVTCLSGVQIRAVPNSYNDILNYMVNTSFHLLLGLSAREDRLAHVQDLKAGCLYEFRTVPNVCNMAFYSESDDRAYVLGPLLTEKVKADEVVSQLKRHRFADDISRRIAEYCTSLPVIGYVQLHHLCEILVRSFGTTQEPLTHEVIKYISEPSPTRSEPNAQLPLKMRQVENRYEISNAITEAVKQGSLAMALSMLGRLPSGQGADTRNNDPLRNLQNYCIVLNTQLRYALQDSGIHPYHLDSLSHDIGLKIERLKGVSEVEDFIVEALRSYCRLVLDTTYPHLSPLVGLAVAFVKEHLSETITVKDTANALTVNANYLSAQFSKGMGMTFTEFVNRERAQVAARFLKRTNLSIRDIAVSVGYNNVSYFAKQFVKLYGQTPRQYRVSQTV
jgi:AraC-like DNA-binding protein